MEKINIVSMCHNCQFYKNGWCGKENKNVDTAMIPKWCQLDDFIDWISVKDRLPDEPGRFWCYVEEINDLGKSHYQWNVYFNGEVFNTFTGGYATHWMPLPEPPEKEAEVDLSSKPARKELAAQGHSAHCIDRQMWGDGECECGLYANGYNPYGWMDDDPMKVTRDE